MDEKHKLNFNSRIDDERVMNYDDPGEKCQIVICLSLSLMGDIDNKRKKGFYYYYYTQYIVQEHRLC